MSFIINIEVTGKKGFVSLAHDGVVIETITSTDAMEHASFLQPAIKQVLQNNQLSRQSIDAIALSNGPGSYTGLRVGLASAKGLSFALNVPLITINTLQVMAISAGMEIMYRNSINNSNKSIPGVSGPDILRKKMGMVNMEDGKKFLVCPIIDARRMEVFFGLYTNENEEIVSPATAILDQGFLHTYLENSIILFTGSGTEKLKKIITHPNAFFQAESQWDDALAHLSYNYFHRKNFTDINNAEPFYCKEFYDTTVRG